MANLYLTPREQSELIAQFESELRVLEFQANRLRQTIAQLKGVDLGPIPNIQAPPISPAGHPANTIGKANTLSPAPAAISTTTSHGTDSTNDIDPASVKKRGYKLSEWDELIIDNLELKQRTMINSDFVDLAMTHAQKNHPGLPESEIKARVTRSLHKLVNRRKDVIKLPYKGKGNAYALPNWVTKQGKLLAKYKNRI